MELQVGLANVKLTERLYPDGFHRTAMRRLLVAVLYICKAWKSITCSRKSVISA